MTIKHRYLNSLITGCLLAAVSTSPLSLSTDFYSPSSAAKLAQCDPRLQLVFTTVLQSFDHTVITGHRNEILQNAAYYHVPQLSQLKFPDSKHNVFPSKAIDVCPYPIDFNDRERLTYFAGFVLGVAKELDINLRWGGDWDSDTEVTDNGFDDLCHFELID